MKRMNFAFHLSEFLSDYLPGQRNVSPNTIMAYRDTFALFLRYCRDVRELPPEKLDMKHMDTSLVLGFLEHLESDRKCSARTRNHRLAALHSFFRYVQTEEPQLLFQCQRILAIPLQRFGHSEVEYLSQEELKAILAQPDLTTRTGRRDTVLLSVLYDTGARVQEIINLSVGDIRLEVPAQVRLSGKGRKIRSVPLMEPTVNLLKEYLQEHGFIWPEHATIPLFSNRYGARLSRSGINYILKKHAGRAGFDSRSLKKRISPHTLRHTKAMHLHQSGNPISVIQKILGHTDIRTTDIYARADMEMKRQALDKAPKLLPSMQAPSWQNNKDILDWLSSL
jgi:site-specific recombinase XerD